MIPIRGGLSNSGLRDERNTPAPLAQPVYDDSGGRGGSEGRILSASLSRAFLASSSTFSTSPKPARLWRSVNEAIAAITEEIIAPIPPTMLTMAKPVKRLTANSTKDIQRHNSVRLNPGGSRKDASQRYSVITPPTKKTIPM